MHDLDFYTWTCQQAELLKQGHLSELDTEHLIEELHSMGASERRELTNRLAVLLAHLLKWQYQPARRGNSWRLSIREQRLKALNVLEQNPGLKPQLDAIVPKAYRLAVLKAARETGLDEAVFTPECSWNAETLLLESFFPD